MKKLFMILLTAGSLGCVIGSSKPAQDSYGVKIANDPNAPVQVISVSPQVSQDGTAFEGAKFALQNTGKVPCNAFSVSFTITFNDAETRNATWQEDHVDLGYSEPDPATESRIMPQQTYNGDAGVMHVTPREPATITGVEAHLDYVEMADGKTYGNDPEKVGEAFHMTRWAHSAERKRLLNVYETHGLKGLLGELQRK
jgi:hypothetical protein